MLDEKGDLILTEMEHAALEMYGVLKVLPVVARRVGSRMALPDVRNILGRMYDRIREEKTNAE